MDSNNLGVGNRNKKKKVDIILSYSCIVSYVFVRTLPKTNFLRILATFYTVVYIENIFGGAIIGDKPKIRL